MTAEIAQKGSCPIDEVPLCNQPCLLSDPALWGRTGDLRFEIFGKGRGRAITFFCPSVQPLLFLSPYLLLFSILNMLLMI